MTEGYCSEGSELRIRLIKAVVVAEIGGYSWFSFNLAKQEWTCFIVAKLV